MSFYKVFIGILLVMSGILAVSYMQKRFDSSDERKALQAVQYKFPQLTNGVTCHTEVSSRFWGKVLVQCGNQSWNVDVVRGAIEPSDNSKNK